MYTNNAYLNHSTIDRKDKSKPLVVTMCGTFKLYTHPKLPTWQTSWQTRFSVNLYCCRKSAFPLWPQ